MTWAAFKKALWPMMFTFLSTALLAVLGVGYASIRQLDRLATMLEVYIPATEKRVTELENTTAVNIKKINRHDVRLSIIETINHEHERDRN
jgi:hypothetical protein